MRFPIAYYLLLLYTVVMFKPLIPMVCDAWGHAFAEAQHIASVHAKYGGRHLEKQLAAEQNNNTKNEANIKTFDAPVHCEVGQKDELITVSILKKRYRLSIQYSLPTTPTCIIVPPPDLL